MISHPRGSAISHEENEPDLDGDIIAWDFDTSLTDPMPPFINDENSLNNVFDRSGETSQYLEAAPSRQLVNVSQGVTNPPQLPVPPQNPLSTAHASAPEHPLEQLFNDGTVRSSTAPPAFRPRKDTLTSRPVSPLPTLNASATQPTSLDMDFRTHQATGTAVFDLRLPDIGPGAPIQIEIPPPEETFRKDPPAPRSRSATVTRAARSDSAGSSGLSRPPRQNPSEPMPQPQSPSRSNRTVSPKPQPPLVPPMPSTTVQSTKPAASNSPPRHPPTLPVLPPSSPPTGQVSSKSVPVNPSPSNIPGVIPFNDHVPTKARSTEFKSSRPPNLILTVRLPFLSLSLICSSQLSQPCCLLSCLLDRLQLPSLVQARLWKRQPLQQQLRQVQTRFRHLLGFLPRLTLLYPFCRR